MLYDFLVMCPLFSCHRLIIILLLYLICPNPNPKVCPHFCLITITFYTYTNTNSYFFTTILSDESTWHSEIVAAPNKTTSRTTSCFASIASSQYKIKKGVEEAASRFRHRFQPKITKPPLFNGDPKKVAGFVIACKLYIRMRIRKKSVEE